MDHTVWQPLASSLICISGRPFGVTVSVRDERF
jgi:hypothetical protein